MDIKTLQAAVDAAPVDMPYDSAGGSLQVLRYFTSKFSEHAPAPGTRLYTDDELRQGIMASVSNTMTQAQVGAKWGIGNSTLTKYASRVRSLLQVPVAVSGEDGGDGETRPSKRREVTALCRTPAGLQQVQRVVEALDIRGPGNHFVLTTTEMSMVAASADASREVGRGQSRKALRATLATSIHAIGPTCYNRRFALSFSTTCDTTTPSFTKRSLPRCQQARSTPSKTVMPRSLTSSWMPLIQAMISRKGRRSTSSRSSELR